MSQQIFVKSILATLAVAALLNARFAFADFASGMQAYNSHDYATAMSLLKPEAESGNRIAQNLLGVMYQQGGGVSQSDVNAMEWYRRSADQGFAVAQTNVGFLYENGRSVERNLDVAKSWYERAAAQGDLRAKLFLQQLQAKISIEKNLAPAGGENSQLPPPAAAMRQDARAPASNPADNRQGLASEAGHESPGSVAPKSKSYFIVSLMIIVISMLFFWSRSGGDQEPEKPGTVATALSLLWAALLLGLVRLLVDFSYMSNLASSAIVSYVLIFTFLATAFLLSRISAGKNWARILFLLMMIIGVVQLVPVISANFARSYGVGALLVIQSGLQIIGAIMLLANSASNWFQSKPKRV